MKTFKQLIEAYQEEDGTFSDENKLYDINKIFTETENIPAETIKISDIDWILNNDEIGVDDQRRIDDNVKDLTTPILITKKGNKVLVVDGFHRLLKAKADNQPTLLAKWVPHDIMVNSEIRKD